MTARFLAVSLFLTLVILPSASVPDSAARLEGKGLSTAEERYRLAEEWDTWVKSPNRPRIGIALGGGGARGMAHIGVIRALRNANIPIDVVAGTSIGSFIGSLYASGAEIDRIEDLALATNWSNLVEMSSSRIGIFSTRRLEQFIAFHLRFLKNKADSRNIYSERMENETPVQFSELKIPFACTATDLHTGEIIFFDTGSVAAAVRASSSIPGLFEPITLDKRLLVDGGVLLNLPVSVCRTLGADIVIAIDLENEPVTQVQGLVEILAQIIRIQGQALTNVERRQADYIIAPRTGIIKTTDLNNVALAVKEGEIAAHFQVDRIKRGILASLRTPPPLPAAPEPDIAAEWRKALDAYRPPHHTSMVAAIPAQTIAAAEAALNLGLSKRSLEMLSTISERQKSVDTRLLELRAALEAGNRGRAEIALAALTPVSAPPSDLLWNLAAAAVDAGMRDLAGTLKNLAAGGIPESTVTQRDPF